MKRLIEVLILLCLMNGIAMAPEFPYRVLYARITAYSIYEKGEKPINHKGKSIKKSGGCAVPSNSLEDGTKIYIPSIDKSFITDDRIPKRSVQLHKKIAKKKGISLDLIVDLRYNNYRSRKQLMKKDLGYSKVYILDNKRQNR